MADSSYGIWRASQNLVTNGGFETNTTGWTNVTRVTTEKKFGAASAQNTSQNVFTNPVTSSPEVVPGTEYTLSFWIKVTTGTSCQAQIQWYTSGGAFISASTGTTDTATGGWQYYSVTGTSPATAAYGLIFIQAFGGGSITYYVDGVQLENIIWATPYIHTDGATDVRGPGRVRMPTQLFGSGAQIWVAARIRNSVGVTGDKAIFYWEGTTSTHSIELGINDSLGAFYSLADGGGSESSNTGIALSGNTVYTAIVQRLAGQMCISQDGGPFSVFGSWASPTLDGAMADIGSINGASSWLNGDVLWLLVGKGVLSDADSATIHGYGTTIPSDLNTIPGECIVAWKADDASYLINWEIPNIAAVATPGPALYHYHRSRKALQRR